jgi:hypothetical protein
MGEDQRRRPKAKLRRSRTRNTRVERKHKAYQHAQNLYVYHLIFQTRAAENLGGSASRTRVDSYKRIHEALPVETLPILCYDCWQCPVVPLFARARLSNCISVLG